MPYPHRLLSPDEEIVAEFRPHWTAVLPQLGITMATLAALVAAMVLTDQPVRRWLVLGISLVWLVLTSRGLLHWWLTQHVVTTERVIHRFGITSKTGREIPLEMINSVSFNQNPFERLVRSGDLLIESAGETGRTRYTDIPDPEGLQTLIYRTREARMFEFERGGKGGSVADQLATLARLHDEGKLTDEEFAREKRRVLES